MKKQLAFGAAVVLGALTVSACYVEPNGRSPAPAASTGSASTASCSTTRGTDILNGYSFNGGSCTTDADCTEGQNGRCVWDPGVQASRCSFDECLKDEDCPVHQGRVAVCDCRTSAVFDNNRCSYGNCRTDADCGSGLRCFTSQPVCGYQGELGHYCETPNDLCGADCGTGKQCTFFSERSRWECAEKCIN